MAQQYRRTSTEINPPYVLDPDMATTLMEEARSLVMAPTMPWLGLGGLRPINPCKMVTRWSVYSTKCLATTIHSFYHSMKPTIPYSNLGEPYYAGYHSGAEQVSGHGPTLSFSPHLRVPEAVPDQDASSEWRLSTCRVSHAEEDEILLTYGNNSCGGGSTSGYGPNHTMAGGSWETPAPQPLQNGDSSMVSVFHQMSSDNHPLILPFYEANHFIQQPRRTLLRWVPLRCRASPGSYDELFAPPPRGGLAPQSGYPF